MKQNNKWILISSAFDHEEMMPSLYTTDGQNVSPPLLWTDPPYGTKSFAVVCEDIDAVNGSFVHWIIFNIRNDVRFLKENQMCAEHNHNGCIEGRNDFGFNGYGGPLPEKEIHRYRFQLYALDCKLNLRPGCTKREFETALQSHILAEAECIGRYKKRGDSS